MMYSLGQILPVVMVGAGVILIAMSEGTAAMSGYAIAGAVLIGTAYAGMNLATKPNGSAKSGM